MLDLHERARAHWLNIAQIYLTVVVVIVAVVVVAVAEILLFLKNLGQDRHKTQDRHRHIHGGVYRVAPQLKIRNWRCFLRGEEIRLT